MGRHIFHVSAWSVAEHQQQNRRATKRYPTSQRAWIMRDDQQLCFGEITDMSSRGAQIRIAPEKEVPDEFNVLILGETFMKNVPVALQWRDAGRVGVRFLSEGVVY